MFKMSLRLAGCLIIGDEVLNGKIHDRNSYEFAKFCFNTLSLPLRKTIVCGDDKQDIIDSLAVLRQSCDLIVTSGGIGSTHDDITYDAIAAAYGLPVGLDTETVSRMRLLRLLYLDTLAPPQLDAYYRMATIPQASPLVPVHKVYAEAGLWVPIVGVNYQTYILPGVPHLFAQLLGPLGEAIKHRVQRNEYRRLFVLTSTGESTMAPELGAYQAELDAKYGTQKVKLGSYPHMEWKTTTLSVIADLDLPEADFAVVVDRVLAIAGKGAKVISAEEEERFASLPDKPNI